MRTKSEHNHEMMKRNILYVIMNQILFLRENILKILQYNFHLFLLLNFLIYIYIYEQRDYIKEKKHFVYFIYNYIMNI